MQALKSSFFLFPHPSKKGKHMQAIGISYNFSLSFSERPTYLNFWNIFKGLCEKFLINTP